MVPQNSEKQCQNTHRSFQQYFFFKHSKDGIVALVKCFRWRNLMDDEASCFKGTKNNLAEMLISFVSSPRAWISRCAEK